MRRSGTRLFGRRRSGSGIATISRLATRWRRTVGSPSSSLDGANGRSRCPSSSTSCIASSSSCSRSRFVGFDYQYHFTMMIPGSDDVFEDRTDFLLVFSYCLPCECTVHVCEYTSYIPYFETDDDIVRLFWSCLILAAFIKALFHSTKQIKFGLLSITHWKFPSLMKFSDNICFFGSILRDTSIQILVAFNRKLYQPSRVVYSSVLVLLVYYCI